MNTLIQVIVAHGDTLVVAFVAIILGWDRFRSGSGKLRREITEDYKERNVQLEEKLMLQEAEYKKSIEKLQEEQHKTNVEVATFKATIIEKDKRIAELRDDLQGRNPKMIEILEKISVSNTKIEEFMRLMHDDTVKNQTNDKK